MQGEPDDAPGECNARLFIADNYGDNSATMRCQLAPGHACLHREEFQRAGGPVTITWVADERRLCDHGCGQWRHTHKDDVGCPKDDDDHEYSDCALCHPGETPKTCQACGKQYYSKTHEWHCSARPQSSVDGSPVGEDLLPSEPTYDEARRLLRHQLQGSVEVFTRAEDQQLRAKLTEALDGWDRAARALADDPHHEDEQRIAELRKDI